MIKVKKARLLFVFICIIVVNLMSQEKKNISYIHNNELPILKKEWKGNIQINGRFYNNTTPIKSPVTSVLKWKLTGNPQKEQKKNDPFKLNVIPITEFDKSNNQLVWLGHASFLIRFEGINFITDPMFFDIPTTKREIGLPCEIDSIKNLDYLLLSHDHRDHFDVKSIKKLIENNFNMEALIPLGMKKLFQKNKLAKIQTQEAGWYQSYKINKDIKIVFLPANHWGRRGLFDFNKTLWGGFLLISKTKKLYFSGDTAYDDILFKEIHKEFGDIDICLLPIGAYSPSFIMKQSHTTPEEANQIFKDLHGKIFIPMHYGTYDLSDEPLGEPIKRLEQCFTNDNSLHSVDVGEVFSWG